MTSRNWIGSISSPYRQAVIIRMADAVLDWLAADREKRHLAALDDRALADFGANRCDAAFPVETQPRTDVGSTGIQGLGLGSAAELTKKKGTRRPPVFGK